MARVALNVIDIPLSAFQNVRIRFRQKSLKPGEMLEWANISPDSSANTLSPDVFDFFKDLKVGVADDGFILIGANKTKTKLKIDEIETYLEGDPWTLKAPDPMDFYRSLGYKDPVQTTLGKILQEGAEATKARFLQRKAVVERIRMQATDDIAQTFEAQYGSGPEGFRTFVKKNPEGAAQYVSELYDMDAGFKKIIDRLDDQREEMTKLRKEVDAMKKDKATGNWSYAKRAAKLTVYVALLSALGTGIGLLIDRVQQYCNEQNGCRMYHSTEGLQDKVQLLTCKDEYAENGSEDAPLRSTCTTQAYPPASGTSIAPCATNTWNPCLASAKNRDSTGTAPLVPNVCDTYLYRKLPGAKDSDTGVNALNACASTQKNGTCSKEYCNIEAFPASFRNQLTSKISLQCYHISFTQGLIQLGKNFTKEVLCEIFGCNNTPPGNGFSWILWAALGVVGVGIAVTFFYKMVTRSRKSSMVT